MDMLSFFASEDVTIVRSVSDGTTNRAGNDNMVETKIPSSAIIHVGQVLSNMNEYQNVQDSQITLLFPEGTIIEDNDKFIVRKTVWELNGRPITEYPEIRGRFIPAPVVVQIKQRKGNVNE